MMAARAIAFLAVALGSALHGFGQAQNLDELDIVLRSVPDGPVARINDTFIEKDDFVRLYRAELTRLEYQAQGRTAPDGIRVQIALGALRLLMEREVLLVNGRKKALTPAAESAEQEWKDQLAKVQAGLARQGGPALTEQEILAKSGMSKKDAIQQIQKDMTILAMRKSILADKKVSVSDDEIKRIYEDNKEQFKLPAMCTFQQL